jgi:hypothetical protein
MVELIAGSHRYTVGGLSGTPIRNSFLDGPSGLSVAFQVNGTSTS